MADTMFDVTDTQAIQAVGTSESNPLSDLANVVCDLEGKIESLRKEFRASNKRNRQKSRSRSPKPFKAQSSGKSDLCFYHKRFGNKARNCNSPCNFDSKCKQGSKSLNQASLGSGPVVNRLFVTDKSSGRDFLIDTGADISVIPPTSPALLSYMLQTVHRSGPTEVKVSH